MSIDLNKFPYFDDYDKEKGFYKVLFKPGVAVQARELTQLQTILQNQVTSFGNHVFKNGAQVIPGSVNVDNQVHFIKIKPIFDTIDVATYLESFRDKIITGATSGVKLRVIDTSKCGCVDEQLNINTLYCKIEDTAADGETKRLIAGEDIVAFAADNTIATNSKLLADQGSDIRATIFDTSDVGAVATTYTNDPVTDVLGFAYGVDVKPGVYYIDGYFVINPELHLYIGRFSNTPTARVGFKVIEELIGSEDDETLLDNAQGSFNFSAPGADRYKLSVELIRLPVNSVDSIRFIELIRVVDGRIQHKVEKASYAELEKTLARRTFDESGNYEVNKFRLAIREHLDNGSNFGLYPESPEIPVEDVTYGDKSKFVMVVDPGKAYIQGYEVEAVTAQYLSFDKAREKTIIVNGIPVIDEGGHLVRVDDQPIGVQNGNYAIVTNVYKVPSNFQQVYLVKSLRSTSNGSAPLTSDIVGTARVKTIQLHSSDYTAGLSTQYKLGLFDIQMYSGFSFSVDVKQIVGTASNNNFACDIHPELITLMNSASSSTSSTSITGAGTNFVTYGVKPGDVLYLNGLRVGTVATVNSNSSITLTANALVAVTSGFVQLFRASIKEPEYETLIYKVGPQFVKTLRGFDGTSDTIRSTQLTIRRTFSAQTASSSAVSFTLSNTNESFLSDSDLDNYLLIDVSTGLAVNITPASITFDSDSNRKQVTFSGVTSGTSYSLIASVLQINNAGQEKTKTVAYDFEQIITSKKSLTGSVIELRKADVLEIKSVLMTPGNYDSFNINQFIDITDRFTLDNGQRSTHYTNGKLVLKAGFQVPSGAIKVIYDYFNIGGTGNYFSADSYVGIDYDLIPTYFYQDPDTGKKIEICLSCVLDFRPIIAGDNVWYPELPKIGTDVNAPIVFYIARQDKVILDSVGRFNIIRGVPAILPQEPEDPKEGMVVCSVYVPPYTKFVSDVKIYQRDNRRYTMKDIGKLDRRISNLEYYVSLSLLEKDTAQLQIKDAITGLDKFKNGFIVDQFTGHGIGDVKNEDYKIAVDSENRTLRPMHFTTSLEVVEDLSSGAARANTGYKKSKDIITLPYTESQFIFNPHASRTIDVNPYKIGAFKGEINLLPEGDNWKDTDRRPDLSVTDDNNYDAIKFMAEQLGVTGAQWNEWQTNWGGITTSTSTSQTGNPALRRQTVTGYETTVTTQTGVQSRTGVNTTLQSAVNSQDYGDRIVDIAYAPYMRARPVVYTAKNLKANTRFYPFFDDSAVAEYVKPADVFKVSKFIGSTIMSFAEKDMQNNILADDPKRAFNGQIEPAFSTGDVLTNTTHTATTITAITRLTAPATSFTLTVNSSSNILPGHHVVLYNLNYHNALNAKSLYELHENSNIPASTGITSTTATAKELNLRKFKVIAVSGTAITLSELDGSSISAFSAYSTSSYSGVNRGMLLRLKASAVVNYDGFIHTADSNGNPTEQDLHVVNVKNGFAIGETLTGSVLIGNTNSYNIVNLTAVNNSTNVVPAFKNIGESIRTDVDGATVGVFYLPNNSSLSFRTGERTFKLIDNISNSTTDFDSKGSAVYYSQGITLSKERTIVNTRTASFVQDRLYEELPVRRSSTSTRVIYSYFTGHDPIAQTFTVSSLGGAFVTSVDLFFSETGDRPITVELRSTDNGVPSTKVIPFSQITLSPQQVKVSENGTVPTNFAFEAPIYLQDAETYALIVKTDQPGCQVFVSELGKTDIVTNNVITSQPLTGSLYLSQNSKEFEINPLLDMKFNLNKATFDISSTVDVLLKANPPLNYTLANNPFEISPSTTKVRVFAQNHGFNAGEIVTISNVAKGTYGTAVFNTGIPETVFNTTHIVLADGLEKDSFIINLNIADTNGNSLLVGATTANFVKGEYGGNSVSCTRSLNLDSVYLKTSDLNFQDTSLQYYLDAEDASGVFTGYAPIVANSNFTFSNRKHIKTYDNQTILSVNPLVKKSSLRFMASLESTNVNVSPVIDLQKISAYSITNLIGSETQALINVPEIDSRKLLAAGDITNSDIRINGVGTITATTTSTAVTGAGTSFTTQVFVGNKLYTTAGTLIGTVASISSNTSLTLAANSAVDVPAGSTYVIQTNPTLSFNNIDGQGVITTIIDTADNLLANGIIGKYITIENVLTGINGTYLIKNIVNTTNASTLAGNIELDSISLYVEPAFSTATSIDMTTDTDFAIRMLDKYVEDFAPVGTHNYANYITRTLTLANAADSLKILFDGSIVNKTDVDIYYRTWIGEVDLRTLPYKNTGFNNTVIDTEGVFSERTIDLTNLVPFTNVSIKIVMKSINPAKVPLVKSLRMIAHS